VLDAVWDRRPVGEGGKRVEHVADAGVADRVGHDRHAAGGQDLYSGRVLRGLRPQAGGGFTVCVGLLQPGRPAVDRPIDHELGAVHPPAPAGRPLLQDHLVQPVRAVAGHHERRAPPPHRQFAVRFEGAEQVFRVVLEVHRVCGGQAGGGHLPHQVQQPSPPGGRLVGR
jgi:hypothetical protein